MRQETQSQKKNWNFEVTTNNIEKSRLIINYGPKREHLKLSFLRIKRSLQTNKEEKIFTVSKLLL